MCKNRRMKSAAILCCLAGARLSACAAEVPYSSPEVVKLAIGPVASLSPELRRAFTPNGDFPPLPQPGPNDWLSINPERGQTFNQFTRSNPNKPAPPRNVIYLQPLDSFAGGDPEILAKLERFAGAFFPMAVKMQTPIEVSRQGITERENPFTGQRQLLSTDLLDFLRRDLPEDAYCRLGLTTIDLYPEPSWNFVFGQASLKERTGVYSFARYSPRFYGEAPKTGDDALALLRSFKVLAHETAHMFGIEHCVYLRCIMNGSNHLDETDASPVHLCPVCLRKLRESIGFDVVERYRALEAVYREAGLPEESAWVQKRAAYVSGG